MAVLQGGSKGQSVAFGEIYVDLLGAVYILRVRAV
jgi:hypothetical protein